MVVDPSGAELARRDDLTVVAPGGDDDDIGRRSAVTGEIVADLGGLVVCRTGERDLGVPGSPDGQVRDASPGEHAAYEAGDGSLVVATCRAHVRTREGSPVAALEDELAALGLTIDHVPTYAPHTAWVSGGPGVAVRNLDELRSLPTVVSVEPELVRARATRAVPPTPRGRAPLGRRPPTAPGRGSSR
ncbi:MAG: hypothetical protein S0880_02760 [Actinomycetota bacterium]|nr:hypothetical protein [Actinomycetota bacterium]